MKILLKRIVICILIFFMLLPTLFSGKVLADDEAILTVERAGNYVSNFAIIFYENWNTKPEGKGQFNSDLEFIKFAYQKALSVKSIDINNVITFNNTGLNKNPLFGEGIKKTADIIDISDLSSRGELLPGDIININHGDGTEELVLYVGGAKIIYPSPSEDEGVLRYEYLQTYLKRIKDNLAEQDNQENKEDTVYAEPKYGATKIYRIRQEYLNKNKITQSNANLSFNGKGNDSKTKYQGIPSSAYLGSKALHPFKWIFDNILNLYDYYLGLITYAIRMQVIGWANLFERMIQSVILGISGHDDATFVEGLFGMQGTSASGDRITVESLFFNKIPILDANFFDFEEAGGHSLLIEKEKPSAVGGGTYTTIDQDNIVYMLRKNLKMWYSLVRNLSIGLMLFVLLYVGIRMALSTSAQRKANYKSMLVSWAVGLIVVLFIHLFMILVFEVNNTFVDICKEIGMEKTQELLGSEDYAREEMNLYDAVRTKAYSFRFSVGTPATIIYIFNIFVN